MHYFYKIKQYINKLLFIQIQLINKNLKTIKTYNI